FKAPTARNNWAAPNTRNAKTFIPRLHRLRRDYRLRLHPTPYTLSFLDCPPVRRKKARPRSSLALFQVKTPLESAATSCGSPRQKLASLLAPGNRDANKLLDQRNGHDYASTVLVLEHDSAFVGLQYAAPVE